MLLNTREKNNSVINTNVINTFVINTRSKNFTVINTMGINTLYNKY